MKKYFLTIGLLLIISIRLIAQDKEKNVDSGWSFGAGGLVAENYNTDESFSSLVYNGVNAGGTLQFIYNNENINHSFKFNYSAGNLKAKYKEAGLVKNNYANFDYTLLFKIQSTSNAYLNCSIGGGVNILYAGRKYNSIINKNTTFESASSLGFSTLLTHLFKKSSNGFYISDQLNVPLFSYLIQPPFGNENILASIDKNSMNSKDIVTFSSFLRLKNCVSLDKVIDKHQKISLSYTWDYYQITQTRHVVNANHSIAFTYYHSL